MKNGLYWNEKCVCPVLKAVTVSNWIPYVLNDLHTQRDWLTLSWNEANPTEKSKAQLIMKLHLWQWSAGWNIVIGFTKFHLPVSRWRLNIRNCQHTSTMLSCGLQLHHNINTSVKNILGFFQTKRDGSLYSPHAIFAKTLYRVISVKQDSAAITNQARSATTGTHMICKIRNRKLN